MDTPTLPAIIICPPDPLLYSWPLAPEETDMAQWFMPPNIREWSRIGIGGFLKKKLRDGGQNHV